jgi:hypothetical protein
MSRWRRKLASIAAAFACVAAAVLAGTGSAAAGPQRDSTLTVSGKITILPAGAIPGLKVSCPVGIGHYDRTHECWVGTLSFIFYKKGVPVGVTQALFFQYMTLYATRMDWSEEDVVTKVASQGTTAPVTATLAAVCNGGKSCVSTANFSVSPIAAGQSGAVYYASTISGGSIQNHILSSYTMTYSAPTYTTGTPITWNSPWPYRCDNDVAAARSMGCVVPGYRPTLTLSIKQGGASAAMFLWAQQHMTAHWGLKSKNAPLTRASATAGGTNRGVVCEDGTFKKQGTVIVHGQPNDSDSCDEFPFAATDQSGGKQLKAAGKTGAACVQLQSVRTANSGSEAVQWGNVKVLGRANYGAVCVRGHIPLKLNKSTGGSYGAFTQNQRLLVGEDFWVAVTR